MEARQSVYLELDPTCQEWIVYAWGTEILKKNMLGIILYRYLDYIPRTGYPGFKNMINNPRYLELKLGSKLNNKDPRLGIYIPSKHHHDIEIHVKNVMRNDFLNFMDFLTSNFPGITVKRLIDKYIDHYKLPGDKLNFEYFKKLYYNNREEMCPKNGTEVYTGAISCL